MSETARKLWFTPQFPELVRIEGPDDFGEEYDLTEQADVYRLCSRLDALEQQVASLTAERDHWKANHDHQVHVKQTGKAALEAHFRGIIAGLEHDLEAERKKGEELLRQLDTMTMYADNLWCTAFNENTSDEEAITALREDFPYAPIAQANETLEANRELLERLIAGDKD